MLHDIYLNTHIVYMLFVMTYAFCDLGHRYRINSTGDMYYDEEPKGKYTVTTDNQQAYGEPQDVRTQRLPGVLLVKNYMYVCTACYYYVYPSTRTIL